MEVKACHSAEDREGQIELFERCFDKSAGREVLAWRYDANPHGEPVQLLAKSGGVAVSGYACNPRQALARGVEGATVGQTGDVMTAPEARGQGVFSGLDRRAMELSKAAGWPAVFGLPNRTSEKLFTEKLGWESVGRIRPWTFVLASDAGARRERHRAGRLASLAVPWSYWRGTMARGRMRNRAWEKVNTLAIPRFDDEVDAIWKAVAKDFDWMVRRDANYLNWRFMDAPSGRFRAHGVYDPEGTMRGYAVVQLPEGTGVDAAATGYVVDLVAVDEVAFAAAMDAALGHLRKAGASVARAWAIVGSWWEGALKGAGFRAPKAEDFKVVIAMVHDKKHPLGQAALSPHKWFFTDGDRDDEVVS